MYTDKKQTRFRELFEEFLDEGALKPVDQKLLTSVGLLPSSPMEWPDDLEGRIAVGDEYNRASSEARRDILDMAINLSAIRATQRHSTWMIVLTIAITFATIVQVVLWFFTPAVQVVV